MCEICENYNIGDIIGHVKISAACNYCGYEFIADQEETVWIADAINNKGFLNHQVNIRFLCPDCGVDGVLGILCGGIDGSELFRVNSQKTENKNDTI